MARGVDQQLAGQRGRPPRWPSSASQSSPLGSPELLDAYADLAKGQAERKIAKEVEHKIAKEVEHKIARSAETNAHHARLTSPSNTAISVWPLADPLLDWEVLT